MVTLVLIGFDAFASLLFFYFYYRRGLYVDAIVGTLWSIVLIKDVWSWLPRR